MSNLLDSNPKRTGYTSITQANNWFLRVKTASGQIKVYPVAVWASDGYAVKGLVSMFKDESPALFTPPPGFTSQYVHADQLTDDEKLEVKKVYHF